MASYATRRNAVLSFDKPILLSLLVSEDFTATKFIDNESNYSNMLIKTISAKKISNGKSVSHARVRFHGQSINRLTTSTMNNEQALLFQHEVEIPTWWTARDFLAVLYILTVGDILWLHQVETFSCGAVPIALVGLSRVSDAFEWSKSELEHIIRMYGAFVVVNGGEYN